MISSGMQNAALTCQSNFLQITRAEQVDETEFYEFDLLKHGRKLDRLCQPYGKRKTHQPALEGRRRSVAFAAMPNSLNGQSQTCFPMPSNTVNRTPASTSSLTLLHQIRHVLVRIRRPGPRHCPETNCHYIFDRFRRQRSSELKGEKGAGLGLNFVKVVTGESIMQSIKVKSELGQGTCFTLAIFATRKLKTQSHRLKEPLFEHGFRLLDCHVL